MPKQKKTYMKKYPETIQVTPKTKLEFEKDRFGLRVKTKDLVTQDEFIRILIEMWRRGDRK